MTKPQAHYLTCAVFIVGANTANDGIGALVLLVAAGVELYYSFKSA